MRGSWETAKFHTVMLDWHDLEVATLLREILRPRRASNDVAAVALVRCAFRSAATQRPFNETGIQ